MKFARVVGGIVAETIEFDPAGVFTSEIAALFVPCADDVTAGHLDVGGVLMPPPIEPLPVEVPVVPQSVTMRQARLALLGAGLLSRVEEFLVAIPGDEGTAAQIDWEYALTVRRDSPLVAALTALLDKTSAEIDTLFIVAEAIQ